MTASDIDTICAIATPPGRSGIGIVRLSGPDCGDIANRMLGFEPRPRHAYYTDFFDPDSRIVDKGVALFFEAPNSFTGEDILELQGHGGTFILNDILKSALEYGCRLARPGEFSERAFMNNKLDLAQVEAIADLINASTEQAARSAFRTLEGAFSRHIDKLVGQIMELRVYLEASIDFTDEDIDFISDGNTVEKLEQVLRSLEEVFRRARIGSILKDGMTVAIAGRPNAGKSSLLNALSGRETAIVTDIPGTTRDILTEEIDVDGMPVHVLDTAGLRDSDDRVEQEGVKRARQAIEAADTVLLVIDSNAHASSGVKLAVLLEETNLPESVLETGKLIAVFNKIDLLENLPVSGDSVVIHDKSVAAVCVSARTEAGIDVLREQLKQRVGYTMTEEGSFIARERHVRALEQARESARQALRQLRGSASLELVAEDLRQAQNSLGEITGVVSSDDLLGQIFASFCIGK